MLPQCNGWFDELLWSPYGYTVCEFVTSKDPGCGNTGRYGENDNSWRSGFIKAISHYSNVNKLVSQRDFIYEFKSHGSSMGIVGY